MGRVFDRLMPYYAHIGGDRVRDVGVYYSLESKIDFAVNGKPVGDGDVSADAHTPNVMNVTRRLISHHIPFGVITRKSLSKLDDHRVLILSNTSMMDGDEADAGVERPSQVDCVLAGQGVRDQQHLMRIGG